MKPIRIGGENIFPDEVEAVRQVLGLVQRVVGVENAFLTVFRQWIEAHLAAAQIGEATGDSPEFDAAMDRVNDLERQIPKIQAQGSVGLAIKAYLAAHYEHGPALGDHPAGVAKLDPALHGALYVGRHGIAANITVVFLLGDHAVTIYASAHVHI